MKKESWAVQLAENRSIRPLARFDCTILNVPGLAITYAKRSGLSLVVLAMLAMWIYGFFFSPRESINKIGDQEWAAFAESICDRAKSDLLELADYRLIGDTDDLRERAKIVREATTILQAMVDQISSRQPSDDKGVAIVPLWLADYVSYLEDREDYAISLDKGENVPFAETQIDGLPISEKIATFANDNRMPSCAPPRDLSV